MYRIWKRIYARDIFRPLTQNYETYETSKQVTKRSCIKEVWKSDELKVQIA